MCECEYAYRCDTDDDCDDGDAMCRQMTANSDNNEVLKKKKPELL